MDTENADIPIVAPGFGSDFVELIEHNRRRSIATSRILRLRHGEIWPEDGMLKRDIGVFRVPKVSPDRLIPSAGGDFPEDFMGGISKGVQR